MINREELPGNSFSGKKRKEVEPEPRMKPVVENPGRMRQQSLGSRIIHNFTGGASRQDVMEYVIMNVVIPGVKDLFYDSFMDGLHRALFSTDSAPRRRGRGSGMKVYTPYNEVSDGGRRSTSIRKAEVRNRPDDLREVIVDSRGEGELILDGLKALIEEYDSVTVADLYNAARLPHSFSHRKWGWDNLARAQVVPIRGGGYLVDMPRPIPLD